MEKLQELRNDLECLGATLEFLMFDETSDRHYFDKYEFRNSVVCVGKGFVNITHDRNINVCLMPNDCIVIYAEGEKTTVANINGVFDGEEVDTALEIINQVRMDLKRSV